MESDHTLTRPGVYSRFQGIIPHRWIKVQGHKGQVIIYRKVLVSKHRVEYWLGGGGGEELSCAQNQQEL